MEHEIYFQSVVGPCTEFVGVDGQKKKITAVISPFKIIQKDEMTTIKSNCNHYLACKNPECSFSKESFPKN